jgi:prepilin-type N-terminal cleavage/methylation domain-containing protein
MKYFIFFLILCNLKTEFKLKYIIFFCKAEKKYKFFIFIIFYIIKILYLYQKNHMQKQRKAFTLVELIVVITILAILWTIAFISLQWYGKSARDSVRLSDIKSMETSLELFNVDSWKYPLPTWWVNIVFSWAVAWTQWTFWESVLKNVDKLDQTPLDPLYEKEYTYSVTSTRKEYEIWSILEWELAYNPILNIANAATQKANAYIKWTYNWSVIKVSTWWLDYVLAVPSIISSDITDVDVMNIINNKALVFNNYNNLPHSYLWTKLEVNGWFDFTPNNIVIFSGIVNDLKNESAQILFAQNLQAAYTWTILKNDSEIWNLLLFDTVNDTEWTKLLAQVVINRTINSSVEVTAVSSGGVSWWWNIINNPFSFWYAHACWIKTNWDLYCRWWNWYWQLWDSTIINKYIPTLIDTWFKTVSLWTVNTCWIKINWDLYCWWDNTNWQVWDNTLIVKHIPTFISSWYESVSLWDAHACWIKTWWDLYCWWRNVEWEAWDGTNINKHIPTFISSWYESVFLWGYHTCWIKIWWDMYCWWWNSSWELWDGTIIDKNIPTLISSWIKSISLWFYYTCWIKIWWDLYCWWVNTNWQLWDGTNINKSIPILIDTWYISISLWDWHVCWIKIWWDLYCWWLNANWQLWDGTNINKLIPGFISSWFEIVSIWWKYSCWLKVWWDLYCWWDNIDWQLWDGTQIQKLVPTLMQSAW